MIGARIQQYLIMGLSLMMLVTMIGAMALKTQNASLKSTNRDLEQSNQILSSRIKTMKEDHDEEIERITELDRQRNATAVMMAPLFTQSDMLAFVQETPDAPKDRFVRDANALNGNLVRLLEQNSR